MLRYWCSDVFWPLIAAASILRPSQRQALQRPCAPILSLAEHSTTPDRRPRSSAGLCRSTGHPTMGFWSPRSSVSRSASVRMSLRRDCGE